MNSLRRAACSVAVVTGVLAIAFAFTSGQTGIVPLVLAVALIAAGIVVWRGGPVWLLLATLAIAVVWYLLLFGTLIYEFHKVGVPVPLNTEVIAWGARVALSLIGLALTIALQIRRANN
jgi:hypothetical protein